MASGSEFNSADNRLPDLRLVGGWRAGVAEERSAPSPQPFCGRFIRALALVIAAVMAHVWLVRAPHGDDAPAIAGVEQVALASSEEEAEPIGTSGAADHVTVETRIVPVRATELLPAERRASRRASPGEERSGDSAVSTHGPAAQRTVEQAVSIAAVNAEGVDVAADDPESSAVGGDIPADADLALAPAPLSASRRLPQATPRIPARMTMARASTPERVIKTAPIVEPDQRTLVNRVLEQYAAALTQLDAGAAKLVYPAVDESALRRAFGQLETQRLTLESCGITISGTDANARCQGETAYRPRVGPRSLHHASGEYTFDLAKADDGWRIVKASVR